METPSPEKFIFQLTVKEYKSLLKSTLEELLPKMIREELEDYRESIIPVFYKPEKDTMSITEAADLTGLKIKSIYSKVSRREMPSKTRGRPLIFSRKELYNWLSKGKPTVVELMYEDYKNKRKL